MRLIITEHPKIKRLKNTNFYRRYNLNAIDLHNFLCARQNMAQIKIKLYIYRFFNAILCVLEWERRSAANLLLRIPPGRCANARSERDLSIPFVGSSLRILLAGGADALSEFSVFATSFFIFDSFLSLISKIFLGRFLAEFWFFSAGSNGLKSST